MWEPLYPGYDLHVTQFASTVSSNVIVALRWDSSLTINYYDQEGKSLLTKYCKKRRNKKFLKILKKLNISNNK